MKKQLLVLSALVCCAGGVLASCDNTTGNSSEIDTRSSSETGSSESSSVIDTRLLVNIEASEGTKINLENPEGKFDAGTEVKFSVEVTDNLKELTAVMLDDKALTLDENGAGSFTMPNHEVTLKTLTYTIGDGSLTKITKLADDFAEPTSKDEVIELFNEGKAVAGTFAKNEKLHNTYASYTYPYLDLVAAPSRDGQIVVSGNYQPSSSSKSICAYFYQAGFYDENHFYDIQSTNDGSLTTSSTSLTFKPHAYNVVDAEKVSNSSHEITKADATSKSSSAGFLQDIINKILNGSFWTSSDAIDITTEVSTDKTNFTTTLDSLKPSSYSSGSCEVAEFKVNVDGDHFISNVEFSYKKYNMTDYDSENKKIVDGATPTLDSGLTYSATRDYKDLVDMPLNIEDFVMDDYDISIKENVYPYSFITGSTVVGNSTYSYFPTSKDYNLNTIKPFVAGSTDDFVSTTDGTTFTVEKVGDFEVIFDNGLGKTKKIPLTSTQPTGTSIAFSKSDNESIFVNEENTLKVTVTPTLATQDATLALDTSKTDGVNATITKVSDGVFSVKPEAEGKVYLVATGINGLVTKTLTLKSIAKPTYDGMVALISSKTLKYYDRYNYTYFFINFNNDGTGTFFNSVNSSASEIDMSVNFTWTLNAETLEFTLKFPEHSGKSWIEIESISYLDNDSMMVSFIYCYYGSEKPSTQSFTYIDRKELAA